MNEILTKITTPISGEMAKFSEIFNDSLSHTNGLLNEVLMHIRNRGGKRMRPILTLLIAQNIVKNYQSSSDPKLVSIIDNIFNDKENTLYQKALLSACSLELLHTASLVHDDVVDESDERRGQSSVNASYSNKIAVLVGDYILSAAISLIAKTNDPRMTVTLSELGMILSEGEVSQQENINHIDFSFDDYYDVISKKTASLFEMCCYFGAMSQGAKEEDMVKARQFGHNLGIVFQIRDDIFDYYDSKEIGKPTGNDMKEGKLTLPVLYVLNDAKCPNEIKELGIKVKKKSASTEEIDNLLEYTKNNKGIEMAQSAMNDFYQKALSYINQEVKDSQLKESLTTYLDYVVGRTL